MTSTKPGLRTTAAIGAAVFVGIGALSIASHGSPAGATVPERTGQTTIQSTPPSEPATPVAVPTMTAHRFAGGDWCKGCA